MYPQYSQKNTRKSRKNNKDKNFTTSAIVKNILVIMLLVSINKFGSIGNLISYILLIVMSQTSSLNALKALTISAIIITANRTIVNFGSIASMLRFVLMLTAGIKLLSDVHKVHRDIMRLSFTKTLILFSVACGLFTIINNYCVIFSLLKNMIFTFGVITIIAGATYAKIDGANLASWLISIQLLITIMSILFFILGIGYMPTLNHNIHSPDFCGPFSHSQTTGTVAGLMTIYLVAYNIFTNYPLKRLAIILAITSFILTYISNTRTGTLAAIISISIMLFIALQLSRNNNSFVNNLSREKLYAIFIFSIMSIFIINILTHGSISRKSKLYILSGKEDKELNVDNMYETREDQMDFSWKTFKKHPLIGIGFGTSLREGFEENTTAFSGSVEKGFLPTGILEETGIIGTILFVIFLINLFNYLFRNKLLVAVATLAGLLITNLGEMMIFSMGGLGIWGWVLIGASIVISRTVVQELAINKNIAHSTKRKF